MLKLKFQYSGHLMRRTDSLEKTLMLGKIQGRKRRGQQRMSWLDGITNRLNGHEFEQTPRGGKGQGRLQSVGSRRVGHAWATEKQCLSDWTTKSPGNAKFVLRMHWTCVILLLLSISVTVRMFGEIRIYSVAIILGPKSFSASTFWPLIEGLENAEAPPWSCPISPFPWAYSPVPRLTTSVVENRRRRADRPSYSKHYTENNNPPWKHCTIHYNSWRSAMKIKTPSCRSSNYTCKQLQTLSEV